jgi:hypothetical protein
MKITESRAKREGLYSGRREGKYVRYGSSYGWKKIPLRGLRVKSNGEIGYLATGMYFREYKELP